MMSHFAGSATEAVIWRADRRKVGIFDFALRWLARLLAEQSYREAIRELECLDDRLLTDIGITRGGIRHAVRYGVSDIASEPRRARNQPATRLASGVLTLVSLVSIGLLIA